MLKGWDSDELLLHFAISYLSHSKEDKLGHKMGKPCTGWMLLMKMHGGVLILLVLFGLLLKKRIHQQKKTMLGYAK